jgi:hypothetical protein
MLHKSLFHKIGLGLVIASLVLTPSTSVFAQSEAVNAEPVVATDADTARNQVFLPLVHGSSAAEVTAADCSTLVACLPPPSPCPGSYSVTQFSGYLWVSMDEVHTGNLKYSCRNAWVDTNGDLHLKLARTGIGWYCANLISNEQTFGFGHYEWQIYGQLEQLDPNIVLRVGTKPASASPYAIATEFSHGGVSSNPAGHYTVNQAGTFQGPAFRVPTLPRPGLSTHRFTWGPGNIQFQSVDSYTNSEFANWNFAPRTSLNIPQQQMGVRLDFCLSSGQGDTTPLLMTEVVIHQFKYTPLLVPIVQP